MSSSFRSFDRRILSRKTLLACVAGSNLIVPAEFPSLTLGNKLLVGNVNDGLIHAFEIGQGHTEDENGSDSDQQSVRTLNVNDNPFAVPGLWGLAFGSGAGGSNGAANQLFFAAGPGPTPTEIFSQGLFGVITPDSTAKK